MAGDEKRFLIRTLDFENWILDFKTVLLAGNNIKTRLMKPDCLKLLISTTRLFGWLLWLLVQKLCRGMDV